MTSAQFKAALQGRPQTQPYDNGSPNSFEEAVGSSPHAALEEAVNAAETEQPSLEEQAASDSEQESATPQDEQEDWSWAEPLKAHRQLHGLELAEVLQALSEGRIPEQLWDKLRVPLKDGDYEWEESLADARNGAMMRSNFTKKAQALAEERRAFHSERDDLINYMRGWKDDASKFLSGARKMGLPVDAMARAYAAELQQMENVKALEAEGKLPPGTADRLAQEAALRDQLEDQRIEVERAKAQQQQQTSQQDNTKIIEATRQVGVQELQSVGFANEKLTEGVWNIFKMHWEAIRAEKGGWPDRNEIRACALATKQQVDAELKRAQPQAKPVAPKLPAKALDGGAPKVAPKNVPGQKSAMTAAQFRKKITGGNIFG